MYVVSTLRFGAMKTKQLALPAAPNGNAQTNQPPASNTVNTPTNAEE
jgi:hypothetical protein